MSSLQKASDNSKDPSSDDKKVVAGGIAISIVILLLAGWTILFFKKIQNGGKLEPLGGGAQDQFLGSAVREAQSALMRDFSDVDELHQARDRIGQQYQGGTSEQDFQQNDSDAFGRSDTIE
ncbi:MAG: hypothetical protein AAB947_00395 [Patescibacteria group bacterium]